MREQRILLDPFNLLDILECSGRICADCHAYMSIKGHISKEKEEEYVQMLLGETWATVKACDENGGMSVLFSGIVTEGFIEVENNLKVLKVTLSSGSFLMDIKKHIRTFQNKDISYKSVLSVLMQPYANKGCIMEKGKGENIGGFLCQYQETDWQFARRLASRCHTVLYPNYIGNGVKFYFGMPHGRNWGEVNPTEYYLKQTDQIVYGIKARDIFDVGDSVLFQRHKLYVVSRYTEWRQGELLHTYELMQSQKEAQEIIYNDDLTGVSLKAAVTKVDGTDVMVSFLDDENKNACGSKSFSYATVYSSPDGTGWYCMPEIDDIVRIYFPSSHEDEAYALHSVHTKSTNSSERVNPDYKSFMNKQGKEILLKPDSILITNNDGMSLELSDDEGIFMTSDKKIVIQSQEAIEITSVKDRVDIVAPRQISLIQGDTQMVLSDKLTMRGAKIRLD